jgi:hypothetical protein
VGLGRKMRRSGEFVMERRQFGRRNTNLNGWVRISGRPKLPCVIRNLTPKGALLEMEVPTWLPFQFELALEPGSEKLTCQVRHVLNGAIGVMFCDFEVQRPVRHEIEVDGHSVAWDQWMGANSGLHGRSNGRLR